MLFDFSKKLSNTVEDYIDLIDIYKVINEINTKIMIFDMTKTKILDTNLLAIFMLIINSAKLRNIQVVAILPDKKHYIDEQIPIKLFNIFSNKKNAFLKPRCVVGNSNVREVEDLLTKYKPLP